MPCVVFRQGFTTYHLQGSKEVRHNSYFWRILEGNFPSEVKDSVKGLRLTKDSKGAVFDLPSDLNSIVEVCVCEHEITHVVGGLEGSNYLNT